MSVFTEYNLIINHTIYHTHYRLHVVDVILNVQHIVCKHNIRIPPDCVDNFHLDVGANTRLRRLRPWLHSPGPGAAEPEQNILNTPEDQQHQHHHPPAGANSVSYEDGNRKINRKCKMKRRRVY